jgi:hypothetical protein
VQLRALLLLEQAHEKVRCLTKRQPKAGALYGQEAGRGPIGDPVAVPQLRHEEAVASADGDHAADLPQECKRNDLRTAACPILSLKSCAADA